MKGLRKVIDSNCPEGTAHFVTPPPRRSDFKSGLQYAKAYAAWTRQVGTITGIDSAEFSSGMRAAQQAQQETESGMWDQ